MSSVGRFILTTLRVLENIGAHPAAARTLLNMLCYAAGVPMPRPARLPADFELALRAMGYIE
jgi:hypothetical protein